MFHVAAILNEPLETVQRFVAWYLDQGATRITLFFDNPDDGAIAALAPLAAVDCIACTPAFWAECGVAPDARFTLRQNKAVTYAYQKMTDGWLLNVDGDEFLYFAGRSIADAVAGFDAAGKTVRVETAEAIRVADEAKHDHFRLQMDRLTAREVYQDNAILFARRRGLVGHRAGKSFVRAGQAGVTLRQHWPVDAAGDALAGSELGAAAGAYLLHYLDNGFARWRAKVDWRVGSSGFHPHVKARIDAIHAAGAKEDDFRALYETLFGFDAVRLARLQAAGCHLMLPVNPEQVRARMFPGT